MGTKSEILKVPGARLYYEVQGSGPVLLLIPAAPPTPGSSPVLPDSWRTGSRWRLMTRAETLAAISTGPPRPKPPLGAPAGTALPM